MAQVTEAAVAAAPSVDAAAAAQKYEDVDFELTVPGSFKEQDINPPVREGAWMAQHASVFAGVCSCMHPAQKQLPHTVPAETLLCIHACADALLL